MALGRIFDKFRKKKKIQPEEEEAHMEDLGPDPTSERWYPYEWDEDLGRGQRPRYLDENIPRLMQGMPQQAPIIPGSIRHIREQVVGNPYSDMSLGAPTTNPYAGAPGRISQDMMRGVGRAGLSGRKLSEALQRFGNPEEEGY
jgi:hypothetical protein